MLVSGEDEKREEKRREKREERSQGEKEREREKKKERERAEKKKREVGVSVSARRTEKNECSASISPSICCLLSFQRFLLRFQFLTVKISARV